MPSEQEKRGVDHRWSVILLGSIALFAVNGANAAISPDIINIGIVGASVVLVTAVFYHVLRSRGKLCALRGHEFGEQHWENDDLVHRCDRCQQKPGRYVLKTETDNE